MSQNHRMPQPAPRPLCASFAPLLPLLSLDKLETDEAAAVKQHAATCTFCRSQLDDFDALRDALRTDVAWSAEAEPVVAEAEPMLSLEDILLADDEPTTLPVNRHERAIARSPARSIGVMNGFAGLAAVLVVAMLVGVLLRWHAAGSGAPAGAPTPTPTSGPTIIYQDPLTSPSDLLDGGWGDVPSVGCFFGSGGYHLKSVDYCLIPSTLFQDATSNVQDADITVQVKQISGSTTQLYGIGLGPKDQLYRFNVESAGKWSFRACHGANCAADVGLTASPAIHAGLGATNTLEVRVVGFHFDFFVNGTKVGQADDRTYSTAPTVSPGQIALAGGDGMEVVFSNLKITTAP
jgi:hypothetical protein